MTLKELQIQIRDQLNADELLRLGGCEAMAEDQLDLEAALQKGLGPLRGVALVVMTPSVTRFGAAPPNAAALPVEISDLTISALERPLANRSKPGALTALAAAQRVAFLLHSTSMCFLSIRQEADETAGTLAASAT